MTLDEAADILNVKRGGIQAKEETELQRMLKVRPAVLSRSWMCAVSPEDEAS